MQLCDFSMNFKWYNFQHGVIYVTVIPLQRKKQATLNLNDIAVLWLFHDFLTFSLFNEVLRNVNQFSISYSIFQVFFMTLGYWRLNPIQFNLISINREKIRTKLWKIWWKLDKIRKLWNFQVSKIFTKHVAKHQYEHVCKLFFVWSFTHTKSLFCLYFTALVIKLEVKISLDFHINALKTVKFSPYTCIHTPRNLRYHCQWAEINVTRSLTFMCHIKYTDTQQPPPPFFFFFLGGGGVFVVKGWGQRGDSIVYKHALNIWFTGSPPPTPDNAIHVLMLWMQFNFLPYTPPQDILGTIVNFWAEISTWQDLLQTVLQL